ncbi:NUDIX hydrolase [Candidatus Woesearchaeota archaeon]|nr:NUDIX hydrolase [Candidatus Woesearchaeota archaeon]
MIIYNDKNEFLMARRNPKAKVYAGLWHSPAGTIEEGENPKNCADRELKEELGEDLKLEFVRQGKTYIDKQPEAEWLVHLFVYKYISGNIWLNHENTDFKWASEEEIREMECLPGTPDDFFNAGFDFLKNK